MSAYNLFSFFTEPVLRAPTLGCMLMCLTASLIGVIAFLKKQSLIGEALSHAAYPGIIFGVMFAGFFSVVENEEFYFSILTLSGAFLTALLGLWTVHILEKKMRVSSDAALCFVLSTFFGVGLTVASEVQFSFSTLYKQALTYLFGQAATMTNIHILIYGILALVILIVIFMLYKEFQVITFDKHYATSLGIKVKGVEILFYTLVALAVIVGIRSVGVILMSAMLIAPAIAARQFTNRLPTLFILAGFFGMASGFLGNYFSVLFTDYLSNLYPGTRMILPTGPMIVLVATMICLFALLFAPERGLLIRLWRIVRFRFVCLCENILKILWRFDPQKEIKFNQIAKYQSTSKLYLKYMLWRMVHNGWIIKKDKNYSLTHDGQLRAAKIVRLHRLWEVYLANYLGIGIERVHCNAEEMEHIITPELEAELTFLLNDPKHDPHQQPIPNWDKIS